MMVDSSPTFAINGMVDVDSERANAGEKLTMGMRTFFALLLVYMTKSPMIDSV